MSEEKKNNTMPNRIDSCCYNCKFYVKSYETKPEGEIEIPQGICRRLPPRPLQIPGVTAMGLYQSVFPTVSAMAICGEFEHLVQIESRE